MPIEQNEQNENVIRKIQRLFEIAKRRHNNDGTSNEAEAVAAMAKAQELLAKYNLELHEVESKPRANGSTIEEKRKEQKVMRSAMYQWQRDLWEILAEANFCFHWITEVEIEETRKGEVYIKHAKRHVILGRESNVMAVQLMGEYLCETIERLVLEHYSKSESLSRSAYSWRQGCASRLTERIREKAERMKQEGVQPTADSQTTGTALVVRDTYDAEYAANYDARHGAGKWAERQAWSLRWAAGAAQRELERKQRDAEIQLFREQETEAQRKARLKKEAADARYNQRYWDAQARKQQRAESRIDREAYRSGSEAGAKINLDDQLNGKK